MPGAYVAFVNYNPNKGIFGSDFVGFKNFEFLIRNGDLVRITKNTLLYNGVFLLMSHLIQIVLAVMLSEIMNKIFKKISQSVILLPHFISYVVVGVFAYNFFNFDNGFINSLLVNMGLERISFYSTPGVWKYIIVFFYIWKTTGYGMIVYMAAITGISKMRTKMTSANLGSPSGTPQAPMMEFSGKMVYTKMAMIITMMRKAVPQRTCSRGKLRAFSTVSGRPCSWQWMVLCSAPWYMNMRRMSSMRPMSQR